MSKSADSPTRNSSKSEFETNWPSLIAASLLIATGAVAVILGIVLFGPAPSDQPSVTVVEYRAARGKVSAPIARPQHNPSLDSPLENAALPQRKVISAGDQPSKTPIHTVEEDLVPISLLEDFAAEDPLAPEQSDSPPVPEPIISAEPVVELPNEFPSKLNDLDETQLVASLHSQAIELELVSVKGNETGLVDLVLSEKLNRVTSQGELAVAGLNPQNDTAGTNIAERRSGSSGLPLRKGNECRLDEYSAKSLGKVSRELGREKSRVDRYRQLASERDRHLGHSSNMLEMIDKAEGEFVKQLDQADHWRKEEAVPALEQILQAESVEVRLQLVKILSQVCSTNASQSLARRALYDVSPAVRDAARNALVRRPPEHFRWLMIQGLRYPWVPVSQHAAEALVALDDQGAIEPLVALLDEPNPTAPHQDRKGNWVTKELVCVNHLRSCLMCHASSPDRSAPVRGVIPTPGKPLPQAYYNSSQGQFVRADVTYLKQDFSVQLDVPKAQPWPDKQRFDFFVRTREVNEPNSDVTLPDSASYPQRDAVLFALRKLTGKNVGNSSDNWRRLMLQGG